MVRVRTSSLRSKRSFPTCALGYHEPRTSFACVRNSRDACFSKSRYCEFRLEQGQQMRYRKFGRTGIEVSDIAPGLWGMGGWSGSEDKQSLNALQLSVDLCCNFFYTAWAYGEGKSDGLLAQTIANNKGKRLFASSNILPKNYTCPP